MIKCKVCGKEYKNKRGLHAHLMGKHMEEYRASGFNLSKYCEGESEPHVKATKEKGGNNQKSYSDKPSGFRPLNLKDEAEAGAYDAGYKFIDASEELYTSDECKKKGWL